MSFFRLFKKTSPPDGLTLIHLVDDVAAVAFVPISVAEKALNKSLSARKLFCIYDPKNPSESRYFNPHQVVYLEEITQEVYDEMKRDDGEL